MTTVTINVTNNTSKLTAFKIFADPPAVGGSDAGSIFMNTWGTAPEVNTGGVASFVIKANYYAICGNGPAPMARGLVISTNNHETAVLGAGTGKNGSDWHMDIPAGQAPIFIPPDAMDCTDGGAFIINTMGDTWNDEDFPNRFCGLGGDNPVQNGVGVIPVAVFAPDANQEYIITPSRKYYIAYGATVKGLQTDIKDIGPSVIVDFTGHSESTASVTLEDNFNWSPVAFSD